MPPHSADLTNEIIIMELYRIDNDVNLELEHLSSSQRPVENSFKLQTKDCVEHVIYRCLA